MFGKVKCTCDGKKVKAEVVEEKGEQRNMKENTKKVVKTVGKVFLGALALAGAAVAGAAIGTGGVSTKEFDSATEVKTKMDADAEETE